MELEEVKVCSKRVALSYSHRDAEVKPAFSFNWHKSSVTSVEWNPNDDSQLSVSSADHSVCRQLHFGLT